MHARVRCPQCKSEEFFSQTVYFNRQGKEVRNAGLWKAIMLVLMVLMTLIFVGLLLISHGSISSRYTFSFISVVVVCLGVLVYTSTLEKRIAYFCRRCGSPLGKQAVRQLSRRKQ